MKISQTEIQAASRFLQNADEYTVRLALHAAYSIRRIRKTAKRERQRKEKDKQVVESVKPADFVNPYDVLFSPNIGVAYDPLKEIMHIAASCGKYGVYGIAEPTPSKAPEWAVTKAVEMWKYYKFPSGLGDGDKIQAIARILAEDAISAKSELS